MKLTVKLILIVTLLVNQLTLIAKANVISTESKSNYDRWHYRTENEKGTYSFGQRHPNAYELPTSYDARNAGYVSPMKDQGNSGICWAFGMIGAMEMNLRKKGLANASLDLSEAHLAYFDSATKSSPMQLNPEDAVIPHNDYAFIDAGGSALLSSLTLSKGVGPVFEQRAPFYPYSYSYVDQIPRDSNFEREFYLKDALFPMIDDVPSVNELLLKHGGLSIAYTSDSSNRYDQYYAGGFGLSNHIVTLVGYNDTIDRDLFHDDRVKNDGGWLLKNSWGETTNGGYFYLSYDAGSMEIVAPNVVHKDVFDYNYYYDASDAIEELYSKTGEPIYLSNIYEGQNGNDTEKEMLHSIGVLIPGMETEYELQIYLDPQEDNPQSGTAVFDEPIKGSKVQRGYYTICLPKSIEIQKGQKFSVVIRLQNRNLNYQTMYYCHKSVERLNSTVIEQTMPNQSYRKHGETGDWEDLHDVERTIAIRALTSMKDKGYQASKTLNPSDFSLNQTTFTYTHNAIEPVVNIHNNELLEMMDYAITYENNIHLGTGKVIVYGMNDYEGSKVELPFTIEKATLQQEFFEPIDYQLETGKQIRPDFKMYHYDVLLEEGKDYTVSYGENLKDIETEHEGSVTLTGIGNYQGEVTMTFNVVNPNRMIRITTEVTPYDAGVASTKSEPRIGEQVRAVVGYYNYNYAFYGWYVNGVLYDRNEEMSYIAKDNMHLVAKFSQRYTMEQLITLYEELKDEVVEGANDFQYGLFQEELTNAKAVIDRNEQNDFVISRAYHYLQRAYQSLNRNIDFSKAQTLFDEINGLDESQYDFVSWGVMSLKQELVEKAMKDYDIDQNEFNELVNALENSINSLKSLNDKLEKVDKSELIALFEQKSLVDEAIYTPSSYQKLQDQLQYAEDIINNENVTQEQVDEAYQLILSVQLVLKANKRELIKLIEECELIQKDGYSADSYEKFDARLKQAKLIIGDDEVTQMVVDEVNRLLLEAKQELQQKIEVNKAELLEVYNSHKDKQAIDYEERSWEVFKQVLDRALSVIEDVNASQAVVDGIKNELEQKANALVLKENELEAIKIELAVLIQSSQNIDTQDKPSELVVELNATINQAQALIDNHDATLEALLHIKTTLQKAYDTISQYVNKEALIAAIEAAKAIDASKYTAETVAVLASAITTAEAVNAKADATQAEVDAAMKAINDAINALKVKLVMDFYDVQDKSAWFYGSIEKAFQKGLMQATGKAPVNGKAFFEPDANITRGMVATVLYRMAGMPKVTYSGKFPDVKNNLWYTNAIEWAATNGVVSGYKDGTFGPDANITRQDLAIMLRNYATKAGLDTNATVNFDAFKDAQDVDSYAKSAVAWCVEAKLMSGANKADGKYLNPKVNATRAECAKMFALLDDAILANNK